MAEQRLPQVSDEERTQTVSGPARDRLYRAADRFAHAYARGLPVLPFQELVEAVEAVRREGR